MQDLEEKEQIEINYWKDSKFEGPGNPTILNLINKIGDLQVFIECLKELKPFLVESGNVLELGAGQGWASCAYKNKYPNVLITSSDISSYAISSIGYWENVFSVSGLKYLTCKSYETLQPSSSLDLVFCFAAAHHFVDHQKTLNELFRVLKPGGRALFIYEPSAPRYLYKIAYWRVNRIRPEVPEDVLVCSQMRRLAISAGFAFNVIYSPLLIKRSLSAKAYYTLLNLLPFLRRIFPCTVHLVFHKPNL
jgi:ubiquinone/menaquinone biosynthesis C-methylase UbiE